ncbi:MAG TPA: VWA domain-containing protein [Thermoanaerobaculia bacterium]|nr:VWA domain-containing protein [Thermoanaerobaculia bacterium]
MLSRYFRTTTLGIAAALCLAPVLVAQDRPAQDQTQDQQPRGQFEERVEVNEVLLDVLVTDRQGNVIVGLDEGDFVVTEDGKPVDLTGVTFYSNRRLVESSPALAKRGVTPAQVPEDRYFILFFEDQRSAAVDAPYLLSQQMEAFQRARDWVRKDLLPNDWVAIVSYDAKLKVHQDFTRDRKALADAVNNASKGKDREGNWPSRIKEGEGPSLLAALPQGNKLRDETGTIYDALRILADASGTITGRKNMLLFSRGFGRVNSFGQYIPDQRYYPDMSQALNDNNVAVYPVDLVPAGVEHTMTDAMNQLANDTGGRYFFNFTNFATPIRQIAEENSGYYLLSYRSQKPAGKSGFQDVSVKASNPEFRVRARKGYEYGS